MRNKICNRVNMSVASCGMWQSWKGQLSAISYTDRCAQGKNCSN